MSLNRYAAALAVAVLGFALPVAAQQNRISITTGGPPTSSGSRASRW